MTNLRCRRGYGLRYAGFFAVEADREGDALPMQKQMTGTGVTVRYDPENPDVSILEDRRILGSEAYAEFALGAVGAKRL
jgi:hypothetical protein